MDSLAEIVIAEGLISASDLIIAANVSEQTRLPLVVTLVHECAVDDIDIALALQNHIRVERLEPEKIDYDSDALRVLSLHDCRRLAALPLSIEIRGAGVKHLQVAMADPTDTVGVAELDHLSGCEVSVVLMPLREVEVMIESAYKQFVTEVMSRSPIAKKHAPPPRSEAESDNGSDNGPDNGPGIVSDAASYKPTYGSSEPTKETTAIHAKPRTIPFRRVTQDATLELRVEALRSIGIAKGLFTEAEYDEVLRNLMKKESSGE